MEENLLHKHVYSSPTVFCPAGIPMSDEAWQKASFRTRCKAWFMQISASNASFPVPTVIAVYATYAVLWWYGYSSLVRDKSLPLFAEINIKRFIVYHTLWNALGLGGTVGLLGFRFKIPAGAALNFLTPGSLCCPVVPQLAEALGQKPAGKRSVQAVVSFVFLLLSLGAALHTPERPQFLFVVIMLTVNLIFDFSVVQCCRLEQNGYFFVCLLFEDWINGCQTVQAALWFWAGCAKLQPAWKYVIPFITKDNILCPFLPAGFLQKHAFTDFPNDMSPSALCVNLSYAGVAMEIVLAMFVCTPHYSVLNTVGVFGFAFYHAFIGACVPFASVQEWNYFTVYMGFYLFRYNTFSMPQSSLLLLFLFIVSFTVPLAGQIYPTLVPFLTAYRPYMGNWRFSWYICAKSAEHKHARLKTWSSPWAGDEGAWFYSWFGAFGKQGVDVMPNFDYILTCNLFTVPSFRPLLSIVEKLLSIQGWDIDDIRMSHSEPYQNQVFGWSLGTGFLATRESTREALLDACGFDEGEMFIINIEPFSTLPFGSAPPFGHQVQWRCYDVTKGPLDAAIHGSLPFQELEKMGTPDDPLSIVIPEEQLQRGKSVKGFFLGTYH